MEKKEFPEEGELLLCTVTKIFGHSVFVNIEDFSRSGMIHISEISPGRIRNLRDYVVEGKKIVCTVLKVDKVKGHVDLSLRRVTEGQRRKKLEAIKQEQKSKKIIENVAKEVHKDEKQFLEEISEKILKKYKTLTLCFNDIVSDSVDIKELGIEKEAAEKLVEIVKERMKPAKIIIGGKISVTMYTGDGIETIKEALKKSKDIGKDKTSLKYAGGGTYNISVTADDYKQAEKLLKDSTDIVIKEIESKGGEANFKRIEAKKN
jgi:translation initiation factor 2 subunit 1|tara:strand:- start:289 stop:1074 length:786 start_codon:yes stop_codon:yes gene_type:complete